MAETYHIYDIRQLPARTAAILAAGLGDDSRTRLKLSGQPCTFRQLMTVRIYDSLNLLCYLTGRGGQRPKRLEDILWGNKGADSEVVGFGSAEEFEMERIRIAGGGDNG